MSDKKIPMDQDPYYSVRNVECKDCKMMNFGCDTCGGPCGQCWACGCNCDGDAS